jgi:DNA sulfur modification protein DndD
MYIKSIALKNFRCHKDTKIEFFPGSGKGNISIIEGGDGDGKTTIFNAIGWCLYGQETSELLEEPKQTLGIPNVASFNDEGLSSISVEMWLEFEEPPKSEDTPISARVFRKEKVRGNSILSDELIVDLYFKSGNPKVLYDKEAASYIESIAPSDLIEFYMFNGEYLKNSRNTRGDNVSNSIKRQFKIGSIKSMESLLGILEREYRDKATKASNAKNDGIIDDITSLSNSIEANRLKKEALEEDLQDYKQKAKDAEGKMIKFREDKIKIETKKELLKQLQENKETRKKIMDEYRNADRNLLKAKLDYGFLLLSRETMAEAYSRIKGELGKGNLPPNIKKEFVEDLISMHECICGRELPEGSREIETVKNLLIESEMENSKSIMIEIAPQLNAIVQTIGNRVPEIIKKLEESIKQKDDDLRNLDQEISNFNASNGSLTAQEEEVIANYDSAEKDFENFKSLAETKHKEVDRLGEKIESEVRDLEALKNKQEKMVSKASGAQKFQEWANSASTYSKILSELIEKITSTFIIAMQDEVNKLISLIRGLSHLSVKINNIGNSVKVEYTDSYLALNDGVYLSEGQNQIISITLIAAYTSVLRNFGNGITESPFIVMDHPFSDLGLPRKEELLKSFKTLFDGTKVIILTPPGDFDFRSISDNMASHFSVRNDPVRKICKLEVQ